MRFQLTLAIGLAATAHAAPTPSLFGDLVADLIGGVESVVTTVTSDVNAAASKLSGETHCLLICSSYSILTD